MKHALLKLLQPYFSSLSEYTQFGRLKFFFQVTAKIV